tara:strand:- start:47 stop:238 length:192 start_codon:yes stop_codon:yes gene_type:complete
MMQIDDDTRLEIRQIVVEMFKETVEQNFDDKEILMLHEWLQEIMSNKIDNYEVNVYGTSLRER